LGIVGAGVCFVCVDDIFQELSELF
jgi:hypothetical protein